MGVVSDIAWCDATWNPWVGCRKVSKGCQFCYFYREFGGRWNNDPMIVRKSSTRTFLAPVRWLKNYNRVKSFEVGMKDEMMPKGEFLAPGSKIFVCSWSDFFIEQADGWRAEVWRMMKHLPYTFLIPTKRIDRAAQCLPADWGEGYPNVWLGVSVEDEEAIGRIDSLLKIRARVHWVSAEPLVGSLDLSHYLTDLVEDEDGAPYPGKVDWVVVGGESGNDVGEWKYRKCELRWLQMIVKDCKEANVPVFVKQLGSYLASEMELKDRHGKNVIEFPASLQWQEFPNGK